MFAIPDILSPTLSTMFAATLISCLLASSFVLATPTGTDAPEAVPRTCGTAITPEEIAAAERKFNANPASRDTDRPLQTTLPVYWHVITRDPTPEGGNISKASIESQMGVLNGDFSPTTIIWNLTEVSYTYNPDWFNEAVPGSPQQYAMKKALRKGGPSALNVYSVGFNPSASSVEALQLLSATKGDGKSLGYSSHPWSYASNPDDDGIVILYSTLPGGNTTNFNHGRTMTHEVGHWLGLYHTSEGGCAGNGDYVSDTPAESPGAFGCPAGRSTCKNTAEDPIHNYMDSTYDNCMNTFTQGQIRRMTGQFKAYRT
ncbi:hypothetical protein HGRIS_004208 [Hohenbuehelia grisea]|uniref:Peptidase M43 pregnancy-associated plasma-A domain-containing protein n=1 Tax=Hohenbuehelia grisea TaxID=104357 RepID=A0ABR3JHW9_9AGAR